LSRDLLFTYKSSALSEKRLEIFGTGESYSWEKTYTFQGNVFPAQNGRDHNPLAILQRLQSFHLADSFTRVGWKITATIGALLAITNEHA
jgi:hypothetical protein